jgi:hypothetical protein
MKLSIKATRRRFIYYDIETVDDHTGKMKPVSISICVFDETDKRLEQMTEEDLIEHYKNNKPEFVLDYTVDVYLAIKKHMRVDR